MSDESYADDGSIYSVWAMLTADDVGHIRELAERLSEGLDTLPIGVPVSPALRSLAIELRDGPMRLGFLPIVHQALGANA